eukprot:5533654-Prymnesium_polylepis.2
MLRAVVAGVHHCAQVARMSDAARRLRTAERAAHCDGGGGSDDGSHTKDPSPRQVSTSQQEYSNKKKSP